MNLEDSILEIQHLQSYDQIELFMPTAGHNHHGIFVSFFFFMSQSKKNQSSQDGASWTEPVLSRE